MKAGFHLPEQTNCTAMFVRLYYRRSKGPDSSDMVELSWRHKEVAYSTIVAVMAAVTATQDRPHIGVRGLHTTLHVYFSFLTYKELYLYDHTTLSLK